MKKFGFVILHYQIMEETLKCIDSIQKYLNKEEYEIIIVDNGSPNKTGRILKEKFDSIENINVIISEENEGFARGNNIGFSFAKSVLKCDFIVLLNNDTRMIQYDFMDIIIREYSESRCAVIGPRIVKNGVETLENPVRRSPFKKGRLYLFICFNQLLLILSYVNMDMPLGKFFALYVGFSINRNSRYAKERQEDVALHGCCLILTPEFIRQESGLEPRTFMYMEEDILYEKMHRKGMKTIYLPELQIEHRGGIATKSLFQKERSRRQFFYRNTIKSAKILLEYKEGMR